MRTYTLCSPFYETITLLAFLNVIVIPVEISKGLFAPSRRTVASLAGPFHAPSVAGPYRSDGPLRVIVR